MYSKVIFISSVPFYVLYVSYYTSITESLLEFFLNVYPSYVLQIHTFKSRRDLRD